MRLLLFYGDSCLGNIIGDIEQEYVVDVACNSDDAAYLAETNDYDAIVVDYAPLKSSTLDLCETLRLCDVSAPMVLLTGYDDSSHRTQYLEAGFNACLKKPVEYFELTAQLKSLIKCYKNSNNSVVEIGRLTIDIKKRQVKVDSKIVPLRRKEYDLLEYMVLNKGYIVSKEELLEHVWDKGIDVFSNTVEVHVKNLRDKIERPYNFTLIKTIWNFGYLIES